MRGHEEVQDLCPLSNKPRGGSGEETPGWPTGEGPSPPTTFQRRMRRSVPAVARRLLLGPKQTALTSERWASCGEKGRLVPLILVTEASVHTHRLSLSCPGAHNRVPSPLPRPPQQPPPTIPHTPLTGYPGLPASCLSLSSPRPQFKKLRGSHHKLWQENSSSCRGAPPCSPGLPDTPGAHTPHTSTPCK